MNLKNLFAIIGALALLGGIYGAGVISSRPDWLATFGWADTSTVASEANFSTTAVVQKVQKLSELVSTRYTLQVMVGRGREGSIFGFGKDKMLLVAQGRVIAGLDLSHLDEQDVQIANDQKRITVNLPPIKLFDAYLVEKNTFVYERETGAFTSVDPNLETEARRQALSDITNAACEDGIMNEAAENAKKAVTELLRTIDFQEVTVHVNAGGLCTITND